MLSGGETDIGFVPAIIISIEANHNIKPILIVVTPTQCPAKLNSSSLSIRTSFRIWYGRILSGEPEKNRAIISCTSKMLLLPSYLLLVCV